MTITRERAVTQSARGVYVLAVSALVGVMIGLIYGGGASEVAFADPGPVVRWGSPLVKLVLNMSMATTVAALVFSAFALSRGKEQNRGLNVAAAASSLWLGSAIVYFLITYLSASGQALDFSPAFSDGMWLFATEIELGSLLAANTLGALVLSVATLAFRSSTMIAIMAAVSILSLYPLAETGHASSDANHALAVNSLLMHLVGVSLWVGGLLVLYLVWGSDKRNIDLVSRYSSMALIAFVLVGISGVTSSVIRIYQPSDLLSSYGVLILAKASLLIVLGIFGAFYRLRLIANMKTKSTSSFWKLALPELGIMGVAMGLGTALAKTPPPVLETEFVIPTPAEILTGDKLPPELSAMSYLTVWDFDVLWLSVAAFGIVFYLVGAARLRARGDKWPVLRTVSWVLGMLVLAYVTNGAPNAYHEYLFSVHMIGHMMLSMLVPVLLVPGAPVTLLSRTVKVRKDDSRGVREWVLWAVHTPYAKFVSHPLIAAGNFALSLVLFYYTPLFRWANEEHIGHQWMLVHFLIVGYLFTQALVGVDPTGHEIGYPMKLILLIGTMAFHAFFGLALMNDESLLVSNWFGAMGRDWGDSPLIDQQNGGAIAWGIGEFPTIVLTVMVVYQWSKSDTRERRRLDRASDRSGNKDVNDYNDMLAKLNQFQDGR